MHYNHCFIYISLLYQTNNRTMSLKKTLALFLFVIFVQTSFGQSNEEIAKTKGIEAKKFEAKGDVNEARKLLTEACILDPQNIDYPFRIAYGFIYKEQYDSAIQLLTQLLKHENVNDEIYQELGNVYHYKGKAKKAIATYKKGLSIFPNSGKLYCEIGNVYRIEKKPYNAIEFHEKGIAVEPTFAPNYHRLTNVYCIGTTVSIWGLLYGELYMNLEPENYRNEEVSELLFRTIKYNVIFSKDTVEKIKFYDYQNSNDKNYAFGIYFENLFKKSITKETKIDIAALNTIRTKFIEGYFSEDNAKRFPNALLEYQNKIIIAGHFEAYNYWLFREGNKIEFEKWQKENKNKWDSFMDWFKLNRIQINNQNKFYKDQY